MNIEDAVPNEYTPIAEAFSDIKLVDWRKFRHSLRFLFAVFIYSLSSILCGLLISPLVEMLYHYKDREAALANGIMNGLNCLCQFVCLPGLGLMSDKFGRKKLMILGIAGAIVESLCCAFSYDVSMILLVGFGRAVAGMTGAFSSTSQSYIADATEKEKRTFYYMMYYIVGMVVPFLFVLAFSAMLLERSTIHFAFLLCSAGLFLSLLFVAIFLPESLGRKNRDSFVSWYRLLPIGLGYTLSRDSFFVGILIVYVVEGFIFSGWMSIYFFYIRMRFSISLQMYFYTQVGMGILNSLFSVLAMSVASRIGERKMAVFGFASATVGMCVMVLAPSFEYFCIGLVCLTLLPPATIVLLSITTKNASSLVEGEILAGLNAMMLLSGIVGSLCFSAAFYWTTEQNRDYYYPEALLILSALLFLCLTIYLGYHFSKYKHDIVRDVLVNPEK